MRKILFILALLGVTCVINAKEITIEAAITKVKGIAENKYCFSEESSGVKISMSYWDKLIPASCRANGFGKCKIMRDSMYYELRKELGKNPFWHVVIGIDGTPLEFFVGVKDGKLVEGPNNPSHFSFCDSLKNSNFLQKLFFYAINGELRGVKKIAPNISTKEINTVKENKTPLSLATESGHYDLVKFLVEEGADVNLKCPIVRAISSWHNDTLDYLLSKGANINCTDNDDNIYPLDIARMNCNKYAIELLEKKSAKEKGDWKGKNDLCNF
ncbi:MAG TPA: ankyrin repeat domain-containing protein [bacterium]|nr:ankyrin repeat domain-containing protein [bacterium]